MFCYKFTDVENLKEIQEKIFENISNSLNLKESHYTVYPANSKIFDIDIFKASIETKIPYNDVVSIGVVIQKPNSICPIHTDDTSEVNYIALNIPIKNCLNTVTKFFEIKPNQEPKKMISPAVEDGYYYSYSEDQVIEIDRLHPLGPVYFNLSIPHAIYNDIDSTRVLISLRIKPNAVWLDLK